MMVSLALTGAGGGLFSPAFRPGDRGRAPVGGRQWMAALLIGGALLVGGNGGVILAEQYAPTGVVALLVATAPLWMAIIDRVIFGRRLPPLVIVGLVVGFGGVALLIRSPPPRRVAPLAPAPPLAPPPFS